MKFIFYALLATFVASLVIMYGPVAAIGCIGIATLVLVVGLTMD